MPTGWARERGCPLQNEPLGADHDRAVQRAERILLLAFDSWRSGGEDATSVVGVVVGTLDWLFHEYRRAWPQKTAKRLQALSPGQCRVHETGIKMICEYLLQDGRRLGTRRVSSIDTAFVDDLFGKLLFKEVKGEKVERRTTVNHAMKTARTAWNTVSRANPRVFPPKNPFEKDGPTIELARNAACDVCGVGGVSRQGNRNGLSLARDWGSDRVGTASARGTHVHTFRG
jgi:hypothetical protein